MAVNRNLSPQLKASIIKLKTEKKKILVIAANDAVNFFQDNFTRQGFLNRSLKPWKERKGNTDPGRGVLIGKGGGAKLYDSIARRTLSSEKVVIGIKGDAKVYASVHNFGLRSGRGSGFIMPKRQFMGESKVLNKKINRLIKRRLKKIL